MGVMLRLPRGETLHLVPRSPAIGQLRQGMHSSFIAALRATIRLQPFRSPRAVLRVVLACLPSLATLTLLTACTNGTPWSEVKDAGVSADGRAIYILIERGHSKWVSGSLAGGGDWQRYEVETLEIHRFDRLSGELIRVQARAPAVRYEREFPLALKSVDPSTSQTSLSICSSGGDDEGLERCVRANIPRPYSVEFRGRRSVIDPVIGMSVVWAGTRLEVTPVAADTAALILRTRHERMRTITLALYAAASADIDARPKLGVEPDRVESSYVDFPSIDGARAGYRLAPRARIEAQLSEAPQSWRDSFHFRVVWHPDASCETDHAGMAHSLPCSYVPAEVLPRR